MIRHLVGLHPGAAAGQQIINFVTGCSGEQPYFMQPSTSLLQLPQNHPTKTKRPVKS